MKKCLVLRSVSILVSLFFLFSASVSYADVFELENDEVNDFFFDEENIPFLDADYVVQFNFAPDNIQEITCLIHIMDNDHSYYFYTTYSSDSATLDQFINLHDAILECYMEKELLNQNVEVEVSIMFGYGNENEAINYTDWSLFSNSQLFIEKNDINRKTEIP